MEQSIEAVEHHESIEGAMDYLLSLEGEGEIFHRPTLDEGHQYPEEREMEFVEESQEERAMYAFLFIQFHVVADTCLSYRYVSCFFGYSGNTTLTILRDERAEERYLMLPELGRVLQELRRTLPGMCVFPQTASVCHVCY